MAGWRAETMPKLFISLLKAIGIARREDIKHRSMEVLSILIDKLRSYPHGDIYKLFDDGGKRKVIAIVQLNIW